MTSPLSSVTGRATLEEADRGRRSLLISDMRLNPWGRPVGLVFAGPSKGTVKTRRCFPVGSGSVSGIIEKAQGVFNAVLHDAGPPLPPLPEEVDTLIPGGVVALFGAVPIVVRCRRETEVRDPVVTAIHVNVVNELTGPGPGADQPDEPVLKEAIALPINLAVPAVRRSNPVADPLARGVRLSDQMPGLRVVGERRERYLLGEPLFCSFSVGGLGIAGLDNRMSLAGEVRPQWGKLTP